MSVAFDCETLFNRAEELAEGVAALGEMLQWAPVDIQQRTMVAVGGMMASMGRDIAALRAEFERKSRQDIVAMECTIATYGAQEKKSKLIDLSTPEGQAEVDALAVQFLASRAAASRESE